MPFSLLSCKNTSLHRIRSFAEFHAKLMWYGVSVGLKNLGPILSKTFSAVEKTSLTINESCFSCQNIGQISILVILVVSKCSTYNVKNPISLIFRGPQTPHIATIFEKILQTILFYVNKDACYILVMICEPSRIPRPSICNS